MSEIFRQFELNIRITEREGRLLHYGNRKDDLELSRQILALIYTIADTSPHMLHEMIRRASNEEKKAAMREYLVRMEDILRGLEGLARHRPNFVTVFQAEYEGQAMYIFGVPYQQIKEVKQLSYKPL